MEHAAKELAAKKPQQVYKEMVLTDKANAPKDIQQLRDLKHRNEKKQRQQPETTSLMKSYKFYQC